MRKTPKQSPQEKKGGEKDDVVDTSQKRYIVDYLNSIDYFFTLNVLYGAWGSQETSALAGILTLLKSINLNEKVNAVKHELSQEDGGW